MQNEELRKEPVDPERVLRTLSERWRGAQTLEYRSTAVLTHIGELGVTAKIWARLRRPNLARLEIEANNPEISCLRVCDGRHVFHRGRTTRLRPAQTQFTGFEGTVMSGAPHPLDETAYSIDQFLAPRPFWPSGKVELAAVKQGERFVLTLVQGVNKDTLTLSTKTYAPLTLVRIGDHGGEVQELLRETFHEVTLAGPLGVRLFGWTPEDEARR